MTEKKLIGVDLGGTNVRAAHISSEGMEKMNIEAVKSKGSVQDVLEQIYGLIDQLGVQGIEGIGLGVPGPVDEENGIVYELINIPAWKKVAVRKIFEERSS